jgi:hypothetical protein
MKRIHIVGLCLVAGIAFSAMVTSSAVAGQYGQCKLLTKTSTPKAKKGVYTDPNCQVPFLKKGKPVSKGNYEWYPGPSPDCEAVKKGNWTDAACTSPASKPGKGKFERVACYPNCNTFTAKTGHAALSTPSLGASAVECTESTGLGEITGPKSDTETTTFTNCTTKGEKCQSVGSPAGTIKTFELNSTLVDHGEKGPSGLEPVLGEVWTAFSIKAPNTSLAIFECTGVGWFSAVGSNAGVTTGNVNVMSTKSNTEIKVGVGEQDQITKYCTVDEFPCSVAHGAKEGSAKQEVLGGESTGIEANEIKA